jgi:HSP20 family protein
MAEKNIAHKPRSVRPRAAVLESIDGKLLVILEMPGVAKEDLEIRIENDELRISGVGAHPAERNYVLRERTSGVFLQTYTLDETVDPSKVDAVLEKGILVLTLDLKEHVKPRTIRVRPRMSPLLHSESSVWPYRVFPGASPCRCPGGIGWLPVVPPLEDFNASESCLSTSASCL